MDKIGKTRKMRKTKGGKPVRILADDSLELAILVVGRSVDPSALLACFELEVSSFDERLEDTVAFFAMVRRKASTQIAFKEPGCYSSCAAVMRNMSKLASRPRGMCRRLYCKSFINK